MSNRRSVTRRRYPGRHRWGLSALAVLVVGFATESRGQVVAPGAVAPGGAYGGYGWGGWGSAASPYGQAAVGMGAFAQGLGTGDRLAAEAEAIRAETWLSLNEYMYRSRMLQRQRYQADRAAAAENEVGAREELQDRVLNNPNSRDIESGDALNNILFALDDPSIPDSIVRDASQGKTLPGATVQKIPFMFSHKGVAISMERLSTEGEGWPAPLRDPSFDPLRTRYEAIVGRILEVPEGEPVPDEQVAEARSILAEMYRSIEGAGLDGPVAAEALRHLKAQAGMVTMLRQPDVKQVLDEAAQVDEVDLPNLLNFMRSYNLQFAAANTQEEKALYSGQLYPMMAEVRDSIAEQYPGPETATSADQTERPSPGSPAGAFEGFDWEQLGLPSTNPSPAGEQPEADRPPAQPLRRGSPGIDPGTP